MGVCSLYKKSYRLFELMSVKSYYNHSNVGKIRLGGQYRFDVKRKYNPQSIYLMKNYWDDEIHKNINYNLIIIGFFRED